jgi:hypothetical protein
VGVVFGALGAAVAVFALLRGAPARLEASTHESVTIATKLRGEWEAARSGLDALLDSIHTERDNIQKANNRLSARERSTPAPPQPMSREQTLHQLRQNSGLI